MIHPESNELPECFTQITSHSVHCKDAEEPGSCSSFCHDCETIHQLPCGTASFFCHKLMTELERSKRIDYEHSTPEPKFSTDYLYGSARGQMFGVMVCRHQNGTVGTIKAFSGQYDGTWLVKGWVPPLFNVKKMESLCINVEKEIKRLGRTIEACAHEPLTVKQLIKDRRILSQNLMAKIHSLYTLPNFKGESAPLTKVFHGTGKGIPTGTGDCCAPKLLAYAAHHHLTPIGLAEFFWGRKNRSQSKLHKNFYPACKEKCEPILGYMLCGLNK